MKAFADLYAALDETKGEPVKAGGFFQMPKGMHHYVWFSEDTILQSNGIGPAGIFATKRILARHELAVGICE